MRAPARYLAVLHLFQLAFLLAIAARAQFCCDAMYYLDIGDRLFADGLLYADPFEGYRSYFVPLVFGAFNVVARLVGLTSASAFPFVASVVFVAVSVGVSVVALRRVAWRRYLAFALPLLFNPFLLAYVPYPLQESMVMLLVVPLLFTLLVIEDRAFHRTLVLLVVIAALGYVIRSSLGWLVLPLAAYGVVAWRARRDALDGRAIARASVWSVLLVAGLLAPQMYVSHAKFGTFAPYPSSRIASAQVYWGTLMYKYETQLRDGAWVGVRYATSADARAASDGTIAFYRDHPALAAPIVAGHVWSGLHYDALVPYLTRPTRVAAPALFASAAIVCLGFFGLARRLGTIARDPGAALLVVMVVMSCAYTAFVATEARFGLFGFAALSVLAASVVEIWPARAWRWRAALVVATLGYLAVTVFVHDALLATRV